MKHLKENRVAVIELDQPDCSKIEPLITNTESNYELRLNG